MENKEQNINSNNKRIAKNTIVLYFRMIFLMLITLFASRVILAALGVEDYGIYNVVGGFVSMFALISSALTSASSRFLNFEMGKGDTNRQNVVFSTAIIIQWSLALIVLIVAEAVGVWYVNNIMVLPNDRLIAANWCFQISIISFCLNLITVPYNASIIAHEEMKIFAYVSVFDGVMKLLISYLVYFSPKDKLVFYASLLLLSQLLVYFAYVICCKRKFTECIFHRVFDRNLLKQMLSYSVWHLVGNGAGILRNHGVNIVLNLFFGPVVNAARGISNQIETAVNQFAGNFVMAMNPQITKSYARNDIQYTLKLVASGSRYSFYLIYIIALPIILNAKFILDIWLTEVPEHSVYFTQLTLLAAIITTISRPIITAQNATGNVRNYQLLIGLVLLLNLPLAYVVLSFGWPAEFAIIVAVLVEILALFARVFLLRNTINEFSPLLYLKDVCLNCAKVAILSLPLPILFMHLIVNNVISFVIVSVTAVIGTFTVIYYVGCNNSERQIVINYVKKAKNKYFK